MTLKDIAAEAGVSTMTVSNVINGNTSKVSPQTAARVLEIIRQRNYIPNSSARSLARSNSNIIAIILRGETDENTLQSPYNSALVGTMIQKIQQHNYYTMVNILKSFQDISQSLRTWKVDGAIFLGMFDNEIEMMSGTAQIPMVFTDSYSNIRSLSNVGIDDYKGGRLAAKCLIGHGHRKIAFVGPPVQHAGVVQHRFSGFCDELKANNIAFDANDLFVLESEVKPDTIIDLGCQLAKRRDITAAFATSDQIASYLIQGLRSSGLRLPEDFSIVGFDDLMLCRQITPQLTTISQNLEYKARLAVDILFRRLQASGDSSESQILDVALVERESVSRPRPQAHPDIKHP